MSKSERGEPPGTGDFDYLDFELEIGPGSGREYPVAVVRSPAGEARETMRFPFDELTLENRLDKLQIALLRSGGKRRRAPSAEEKVVQDFGRDLFDTLLSGEVRSRYDVSQREAAGRGKGLRLKLRIQVPGLAALPWEFLYDPRQAEYVCLSRNTPVVRYLELPQPIQPLAVTPPLRILGMIASPRDLPELDVARERQRVERAIQDLRAQGLVELHWMERQTWRDLQRAMRRGPWHVFHFIGHGGFDRAADEGFVALVDREGETYRLSATQLGRLLADHRWLRLVLLNACEGARGSKLDIFSSTATILVRRGIPAVLAMQYEITDRAAIEFARAFYEALAEAMPIDAAVSEARKAVSLAVANTVEWGTPVLYMRSPDGVLFSIQEAEARAAQEKEPEEEEIVSEAGWKEERRQALEEQLAVHYHNLKELEIQAAKYGPLDVPLRIGNQIKEIQAIIEQIKAELTTLAVEATPAQKEEKEAARPEPARLRERRAEQKVESLAPTSARLAYEPETVLIPGGEFLMGSDLDEDEDAYDDELPQHRLTLADYYLAKTPVTNAQYAAFVEARGHEPPEYWSGRKPPGGEENHPVVWVSWHDAVVYCEWLSEVTGRRYRLPSEAQWEKGARGVDGRIYPWGDEWDPERCNWSEDDEGDTTPVGSYPRGASPYGLLDMAGNVWEWTRSLWGEDSEDPDFDYPYDAEDGREDLAAGDEVYRVCRGGAFDEDQDSARCAYRDYYYPEYSGENLGFRVAVASA